ncbi:MAG: hypothetical protein K9M54_02275 [Kiritimatiellales bacterium]|nr:hypothetical protein [Kiritimatiellales bacterium]
MQHGFQHRIVHGLLAGLLLGTLPATGMPEGTVVPVKKTGRYIVTNWRVKDGLPFDQIRDIVQRRNGFIWVATLNGAARFDGVQFQIFNTRTSSNLANNSISALFEDREERLWLGHDTGHLTVRIGHAFQSITLPDDWPKEPVIGFVEESNGTVWAMNRVGDLLPLDGEKSGAMKPHWRAMASASTGRSAILAVHGDRIVTYAGNSLPLGSTLMGDYRLTGFSKTFPGSGNSLWILTAGRLRRWSANKWVEDIGEVPWQDMEGTTLIESSQGAIFAGSQKEGLFVFDRQGGVERLNRGNGMEHNEILCLYEDREGTIWAGTGAGLSAIRPRRINMVYTADAWKHRFLRSVSPRLAGGVWVGTDGGGLYSVNGQEVLHMGQESSPTSVQTVLEDDQGTVWLNSQKGFLCRMDDAGLREIPPPQPDAVSISALYQENNGMLWAGGLHGLWRWNGVAWNQTLPDQNHLSDIRCITGDHEGAVWFGMASGGLGRLYNGKLEQYGNADGLPSEYIRALYFDQDDDSLWIGTCGGGLALWRKSGFSTLSDEQGMPGNVISFILDDRRNRLWMVTNQGLAVVDKNELKRVVDGELPYVSPLLLDSSDGLSMPNMSDGLQAGCRTADGLLYFATDGGLVMVNPDDVQRRSNPIQVLMKTLLVNDQTIPLPYNQPIHLPPGVHRLNIQYTALSFISPHRIRFMYRLTGHDTDWIDADTRRIAMYQHLPPGAYQFEVKACNSDGVWNQQPASLDFTVRPFFWETWWLKGLVILAGTLLAVVLSLGVAERINRRKLILAEKLRAVEQERTRISMDIHDEIGAGLTRISLLSHLIGNAFKSREEKVPSRHINEMEQVAAKLVRALDEIVWVVTPRNDTLDSLSAYLAKYVANYLRETDIRCTLDIPIDLPDWAVPGPIRHNLFLAVKEAVNNIVKHAEATDATFSMAVGRDSFSIIIRDNGKGVGDRADDRFRRGLTGMKERMELIGGHFEINENPAGGAIVTMTLHKGSMHT